MLSTEHQCLMNKILARRFELPSMSRFSNLQIKSIDFKTFIAPKADRIHNVRDISEIIAAKYCELLAIGNWQLEC